MTPSKYQKDIYDVFTTSDNNINISAVAGSGKTTVLLELLKFVPDDKQALFVAFNNSIVDELKRRIGGKSNVEISTIHAYGWRSVLCRYGSKVKMNPNKVFSKIEGILKQYEISTKKYGYYFYIIPKIIDLMRCNLTPLDKQDILDMSMHYDLDISEVEAEIAMKVFEKMNRDKSQFDFMDMIYQPVTDAHIRLRKYDYVFCDESQDFSICQQKIIQMSLNRKGRLITVGDEHQSIYGFAGADANSYQKLSELNGESVKMPLSVCYRCSKSVVIEAQKIVPEIQYAPDAEMGCVREGSMREDLEQGDWILCRNLKPLVQTYLWLMKNKVKSKIKGKDIGEGILSMINKTGAKTLRGMWTLLELEKEKLCKKLKKRGVRQPSLHPKMELFTQRTEVIECLMNEVTDVQSLKKLIENIFTDEVKGIMLSTIHKSKGLENNRILFLCPELIPSRYATTDWMAEQEMNLYYVAVTRAKHSLIYVMDCEFKKDLKSSVKIN
jgi:superfamily I DNA/RNA helicase